MDSSIFQHLVIRVTGEQQMDMVSYYIHFFNKSLDILEALFH